MNKELKLEDIANLEATKLFKDAGYKLKIVTENDWWDYEPEILKFTYFNGNEDFFGSDMVYISYKLKDSNIKIELSHSIYNPMDNIVPLMYPIMKLIEELQIDIEQIYFNEVKGDNDE